MSERVRREIRDLVDGFGPPHPGLAARAVAGLPDRPGTGRAGWLAATAVAVIVVGTVAALMVTARRTGSGPTPGTASNPSAFASLRQRPLQAIPLASTRSCQVDQGRVSVRGTMAPAYVTYVSASNVPPDDLMTIQIDFKAQQTGTLTVIPGSGVSGPVLVRAHRLDGQGTITLGGKTEQDLDAGQSAKTWAVTYAADTPGCYAIQFDGARFTEAAVFLVVPPSSLPPNAQPTPQAVTPGEAATMVRATVTSISPVLLPAAVVGSDWRAQVRTAADSFTVTYTDPTGARQVTVSSTSANPALPIAGTTQTHPSFHGDGRSLYQVNNSADPVSARILMWREPGTSAHPDPSYPGVTYFVSATGLTDAEFWQVANSLH